MLPPDFHNKQSTALVKSLVSSVLEAGGDGADVMMLLENVISSVILTTVKPEHDEKSIGVILAAVTRRLQLVRASTIDKGIINACRPAKEAGKGMTN